MRSGRARRGRTDRSDQRGAVTAETVLVLPLLASVTLAMVWLLTVGIAQVRVTDAAREAARALARGESTAAAEELVGRVAPGGRMSASRDGDRVVVTVTESRDPPFGLALELPGFTTEARAVALVEPR